MSEEKTNLGRALEETKAIIPAKELYDDLGKPLAKELGKTGKVAGQLVNSVLRPLKSLDLSWNVMFDNLDQWLEEKLRNIPESEIQEPNPNVAGNILSGLVFAQDDPTLRDMFVSLLASSMTKSKYQLAHPSYAGILKEMTPDEARISQYLKKHQTVPIVRVRARIKNSSKNFDSSDAARCMDLKFPGAAFCSYRKHAFRNHGAQGGRFELLWTDIGDVFDNEYFDPTPWADEVLIADFPNSVSIEQKRQLPLYLDNLIRHRIAHMYLDNALLDMGEYKRIFKSDLLRVVANDFEESGFDVSLLPCMMTITNFGRNFHSACVSEVAQKS